MAAAEVWSPSLTSDLPNLSLSFPTRTIGSIGFLHGTPWEKRLSTLYASFNADPAKRTCRACGYVFPTTPMAERLGFLKST